MASQVPAAAVRTVAAGSARLFAAWCTGSPVPEAADRRCDGVADLAARRARVSQSMFFTDRATAALTGLGGDDPGLRDRVGQSEMIFGGANAYVRVADSWTGFFLGDADGPRGLTRRYGPGLACRPDRIGCWAGCPPRCGWTRLASPAASR